MKKKFWIPLLAIILIAASLAWKRFYSSAPKRAKDYNLVLISIDTTRADFLGCYGNSAIATPNIDAIARDGVLFENHYTAINTTLASHSSIFTSLYPRNHGVGRNGMRLNAKN